MVNRYKLKYIKWIKNKLLKNLNNKNLKPKILLRIFKIKDINGRIILKG